MSHFEDARARYEDDLSAGKIGCVFGKEAARKNEVSYLPFPRNFAEGYIFRDDVAKFAYDTRKSVLVIIPQLGNPVNFDDGRELAFKGIFSTLAFVVRDMALEQYLDRGLGHRIDADSFREFFPIATCSIAKMQKLLAREDVYDLVCSNFIHDGDLALRYVQREVAKGIDVDTLIPLTMAPYYTPRKDGKQHPRYARDFGVIVTRQDDIAKAIQNRKGDVARIREWKKNAIGRDYVEGLHIPLDPPETVREARHIVHEL